MHALAESIWKIACSAALRYMGEAASQSRWCHGRTVAHWVDRAVGGYLVGLVLIDVAVNCVDGLSLTVNERANGGGSVLDPRLHAVKL